MDNSVSTSKIEEWQSLTESVRLSCAELQHSEGLHREVVNRITVLFHAIDREMENLSDTVCSTCVDVCCRRATIWFDRKDLIYIYLLTNDFPPDRVTRTKEGACCFLGDTGCRLPRMHRPFICTWYICPAMRQHLADDLLLDQIEEVKRLRKQLAAVITGGRVNLESWVNP